MRLIDANALVIEELLVMDRDYIDEFASGVRKVMNTIRRLPTVDAVEVVHGQWVYDHWCEFKCSVCGEYSNSKPYKAKENYCPNCGAKMDGGKN